MQSRTISEWILFFVTINLLLATFLMMFVPLYPWWFFAILTVVSKVASPYIFPKNSSGKKSNRRKF